MVLGGWERMLREKPICTGLLSKKWGSEGNRLAVPNQAGAGGSSRLTAAGPAADGRGRGRRSADWVRGLLARGPPGANAGTDVRGRGSHGDGPPTGQAGPTMVPIETRPAATNRKTGGLALVGAKSCPGYTACAIRRRIIRAPSACPSGLTRGTRASCAPLSVRGPVFLLSSCHEVPSICCL